MIQFIPIILVNNDEIEKIANDGTGMERRLAWTCQHWHDQAIRCADQAMGIRNRAVALGLGRYSINDRGEGEFYFNGDSQNL